MKILPQKHLFSVTDWQRLEKTQLFAPAWRGELIEGEIIDMPPIGSRHASTVDNLVYWLTRQIEETAVIRVQNPIQLGDFSELQPDIALVRPPRQRYRDQHPLAADVLLLIEVADSTVHYDRTVKIPLYARHNIGEVWLVNLEQHIVEIYLNPYLQGYVEKHCASLGHRLIPTQLPQISIAIAEII